MGTKPRFTPGKKYALDGETLNTIFDQLALNQLLPGPGYDLVLSPGKGTTLKIGSNAAATEPWGLISVGTGYMVNSGRIYTSYADLDSYLTITEGDLEIDPAEGDAIWLELTNANTASIDIELKSGPLWGDHPAPYTFSEDPVPVVETSRFILWEFPSGDLPVGENGFQINPDFYAKRYCRNYDLVLIWGSHELDDTWRVVPIPLLAPF